ncbi:MAG TPA: methyltransferase [Syntrophorhabdales bacterium]|nr:methyltransferase [Syntrophorhabdales bacterium]
MQNRTAPSFADPDDFERFRSILEGAGYTDKGVIEALGVKDFPSVRGDDLPVLLRRTSQGTPVDIFVRLFLMQVPVDSEALREAIRPMKLQAWIDGGLVRIDGNSVITEMRLLPFQGFLIAFDPERRLFSPSASDYVMGIGASSLTLANHTVRRHARVTLDLGTGCGIQALLAARHSDLVFAVDRNPRAVQVAAFNAKLNRLSHVECREGDLFEPVKQEKFDLIVSNPPFVISPGMRYIYRDSGMEGDQICQKIVRQAPQFLTDGGFCQILCNWAEYKGQDWRERLAGWFDGTGCDAWVMRSDTQDTAHYASTWIRHTERLQGEEYAHRFEEWMAHYDRQGIEAVSAGFISLRHSPGRGNWFRAEDGLGKGTEPCGDSILRGFELRDFLETVRDDETLLDMRFRVSPDVRLEQQYAPSEGKWAGTVARLSLVKGLDYSGEADPHVARLIGGCDGSRTLGELFVEMATSIGLDPANIRPAFLQLARRFIERGFILPFDFQP